MRAGDAMPGDHARRFHGEEERYRDAVRRTAAERYHGGWWALWQQHTSIQAGDLLVDLGCGTGELLAAWGTRHPHARRLGVEGQAHMVAEHASPAQVVQADLCDELPLASGSAQVVSAVLVLHEVAAPLALLSQARRLLAPGGVLFLVDWVRKPLRAYAGDQALSDQRVAHFRAHCSLSLDDLACLCQAVGLEVVETRADLWPDYGAVVARRS